MAPPDTPLLLTSSVTRVDDAAEPYSVQIAITLRAAPDDSGQARAQLRRCGEAAWRARGAALTAAAAPQDSAVYARGNATFHKIGAVRSLNS